MTPQIIVWNAQGCGSNKFIRFAHQYIRDHHPDIFVFIETHISGDLATRAINALGFSNFFRVEAPGFSGGIWICWFDNVHDDVLLCLFQFILCRITIPCSSTYCLVTFVYMSLNAHKRKALWSYFRSFAHLISEPWIIIRDFNATLYSSDRQGCVSSSKLDSNFQSLIFDCGLHDLGHNGPNFTWYKGSCAVRLDRGICNGAWLESFPASSIQHLLRMKSDHHPLMLTLVDLIPHFRPKFFRYFVRWIAHPDFNRLVHSRWDSSISLVYNVSHFSKAVDSWNSEVYGSIGKNKRSLMARLCGVQKCLAQQHTTNMLKLEFFLQRELELIFD
ncbi:hypothetical protein V6N13_064058 [Hibiscus sabdariffa]